LITKGKLTAVLFTPSSWVPNWFVNTDASGISRITDGGEGHAGGGEEFAGGSGRVAGGEEGGGHARSGDI
jgi:hypothetical protein